jgi:hypothetical protein
MSARDDYPKLAERSGGSNALSDEINAALVEIDRLRAVNTQLLKRIVGLRLDETDGE